VTLGEGVLKAPLRTAPERADSQQGDPRVHEEPACISQHLVATASPAPCPNEGLDYPTPWWASMQRYPALRQSLQLNVKRMIGAISKIMLFYILIRAMIFIMIIISTKPLPAQHLDVLNS
jgi:hypothetical protein